MAPTIAGDIIRVRARFLYEGTDEQVNVFHYQINTAPGAPDDIALTEDVAAHLSAAYLAIDQHIVNNIAATAVDVYNVSQDYPLGAAEWTGGFTGGTGTGEGLPPQVACMVLWRTTRKNTVGKTYLPTMLEAAQNDGRVVSGVATDVDNFIEAMQDTDVLPNGYSLRLRVYSYADGAPRTITIGRCATILATLRSRKLGRGS